MQPFSSWRRPLRRLTLMLAAAAFSHGAFAQTAICYNCPPEWADWATQIRAINDKTGVTVPLDNKNSGQSLAQLVAEKASPVADVVYYGVTFGIQAKKDGVTAPYKPAHWNEIPDGLKDPQGNWFAIHSGTLGFMVNVDALRGKPVPQSWADLQTDALCTDFLHYFSFISLQTFSTAFAKFTGPIFKASSNEVRSRKIPTMAVKPKS